MPEPGHPTTALRVDASSQELQEDGGREKGALGQRGVCWPRHKEVCVGNQWMLVGAGSSCRVHTMTGKLGNRVKDFIPLENQDTCSFHVSM